MTDNQRCAELMGLCWHELTKPAPFENGYFLCEKCGKNTSILGGKQYDQNIQDAWKLVEWMEKYGYDCALDSVSGDWDAVFNIGLTIVANETAPTAPQAIVKAFLAANGGNDETA